MLQRNHKPSPQESGSISPQDGWRERMGSRKAPDTISCSFPTCPCRWAGWDCLCFLPSCFLPSLPNCRDPSLALLILLGSPVAPGMPRNPQKNPNNKRKFNFLPLNHMPAILRDVNLLKKYSFETVLWHYGFKPQNQANVHILLKQQRG